MERQVDSSRARSGSAPQTTADHPTNRSSLGSAYGRLGGADSTFNVNTRRCMYHANAVSATYVIRSSHGLVVRVLGCLRHLDITDIMP